MSANIDEILQEVATKDMHVLCREVMSITDTMEMLRSKWNEIKWKSWCIVKKISYLCRRDKYVAYEDSRNFR